MVQKSIFRRATPKQGHATPKAGHFSECRIKETCQSCRFINEPYDANLGLKFTDGVRHLREQGVIDNTHILEPVASPKQLEYRTHAKLAVRPGSGGDLYTIGLFQPRTHIPIDLSYCPLHAPNIGKVIRALKPVLAQNQISAFDEKSLKGDLRYLVIRSSHVTDELMVTFVMTRPLKEPIRRVVKELQAQGHKIAAAWLNVNNDPGNAIFGLEDIHCAEAQKLRSSLCDLDLRISHKAFFQINPWMAEILYTRVASIAGTALNGQSAWDLYCGTGQLALLLGRSGFQVLGIEESKEAVQDAELNALNNALDKKCTFLPGRFEDLFQNIPSWAQTPSVIVCNPSRRGIDENARHFLGSALRKSKGTLVYVSCEVETLARDLQTFQSHGLKVKQLEAFDMFPQTEKVEWIAVIK